MKQIRTKLKRRSLRPRVPSVTVAGKTSLRDKLLGVAILFAAAVLFLFLTVLVCRPLVGLISDPGSLRGFVNSHKIIGRLAFVGIQTLQGILPIPLELTTIAGGYVFGKLQGCLLTLCATVISTAVIFYFTRQFGHRLVDLFFTPERQKSVRYFRDEKMRDTVTWIVFLIPGTPKRLFVFSAGLVPQDFRRFLVISTAARVPALLACSFGGDALSGGNYTRAVVIFLITGAVTVLGLLFYRYVDGGRKKKGKNKKI